MELRGGRMTGRFVLPPNVRPAFEEGVSLVCSNWTALGLAVENEWGGRNSREKADQLIADAIAWFYSKKEHYADDLEVLLNDMLSEDFNVQLEDGSAPGVAQALIRMHADLLWGDTAELDRLRARQSDALAASRSEKVDRDGTVMDEGDDGSSSSGESDDDGDSDGSDAMDTDAPQLQRAPKPRSAPVIDEDGFEVVQRKGRR